MNSYLLHKYKGGLSDVELKTKPCEKKGGLVYCSVNFHVIRPLWEPIVRIAKNDFSLLKKPCSNYHCNFHEHPQDNR